MRICFPICAMLMGISTLSAQTEEALKQRFEGAAVVLKIDMPATQLGVDVYPSGSRPVDFSKVLRNLKEYGIGVNLGESVTVTRVKVRDKSVEVYLGGGGFGTFPEIVQPSSPAPAYYQGKSQREKDLEDQLKYTWDNYPRSALQEELDSLRRRRNRDNAWTAPMNSQAQRATTNADEGDVRRERGSRFNIRYDDGFAERALTPEAIMAALAKYVVFLDEDPTRPKGSVVPLRKGLTISQVEDFLGPAAAVNTKQEGSMAIVERRYSADGKRVSGRFVGGVLVDYNVAPDH